MSFAIFSGIRRFHQQCNRYFSEPSHFFCAMVVAAVIALPAAAMLVTAEVNPVVALQRYAAISADSRSRYKRQGELEAAIFGSRGFVDSNKDGRISDAELLAAYKIIGKSPEMVFPPLTLDDLEHIAAYYK